MLIDAGTLRMGVLRNTFRGTPIPCLAGVVWAFFLARSVHVITQNRCGGGACVFSLVLAFISTLTLNLAAPSAVQAAEPTACPDGCDAYIWNGDSVVQLKTQTGETPKFTSLDQYEGPSADTPTIAVFRDSDGKTWTFTGEYLNPTSTVGSTPLEHGLDPTYSGHSARGDASGVPAPVGTIQGIPAGNILKPKQQYMSVDVKGRLWVGNSDDNPQVPTVEQDSDDIEFTDIDFGVVDYSPAQPLTNVFLLGKPRAQTPQTVINQMPTTGAPEGLTSVGIMAAMLGLFGLGLIAVRRRS